MTTYSAGQLLSAWDRGERAAAHRRLGSFLAATEGQDRIRAETLGERNRRLLRLHRDLVGWPLEAHITCGRCAVDNEFVVPSETILAAAAYANPAHVRIRSRGRSLTFRVPRIDDIETAGDSSSVDDVRRAVLERCRLSGDLEALTDAAIERLGREFEARDPLANIVVTITCTGCGATLTASIDLASFVAADLDRLVDALYREVHELASAYGWDERTIVALPADRRRRYIELIAARTQTVAKRRRSQ